eukprot:CAMPEP_0198136212 /NCGR_PEP_ID=MMETSP1442-20131203/60995_1 /TAXON_ID= /ORGANISM="Craspedostauros australis, Strain CCMP3328" /LENGTH=46 /DNA_ID= /DNA_START= /DNA_END= /DNA_ORIENTATION=
MVQSNAVPQVRAVCAGARAGTLLRVGAGRRLLGSPFFIPISAGFPN